MELNFKDFFTFDTYKEIANLEIAEKQKEKPDYTLIFKGHELYNDAMLNYLKARAEKGLLKMPVNSSTHYSNMLSSLNNLVKNKLKNNDIQRIKNLFEKLITNNMMEFIFPKKNLTIEQNYERLINQVNEGNFGQYELNCDSECFGCGKKIEMVASNWNFILRTLKMNENRKYNLELLPECIEEKIYEVKVEFKTGELLMADWFRIKEFTEHVEYDPEYKKISINVDLGQINSTEHAASLGFVTIHVGNSCPTVYQKEEDFIFGYETEESNKSDYKPKGNICTDLWNITVIDKSRLIEIVAETLGEDKAKEVVEEYLSKNKSEITKINVQPGEYVIGFCPRKDINILDKEIPQDISTIFTMKKVLPKKKLKM